MGRRCACDRLLEAMRSDPRLRVIPAAARYMWLALADALLRLPEPGVFLLGSRVGSTLDIQMMLSMPEPEVETCLGILMETQLITRRDDGVLVLPDVIGAMPRASTSAANGRKSLGRPRKGETPDQYQLRLLGQIQGGRVETQETQRIPDADNPPHARAAATSFSSVEAEASKQPRANTTELGNQLAELARMDTLRGAFNFRPVEAWLAEGATPELLVDVVGTVAARAGYQAPKSMGYFTGAVREAILRRAEPAAPVSPGASRMTPELVRQMDEWVRSGCWGEPPARPAELAA